MHRIDLLSLARAEIPGPQLFWMAGWGDWHPIRFQVVLIRRGDVVALVNTGPADDLSVHTRGDYGFLGEGARMWREGDDGLILDQLARHGVRPEDVTHVILTPLTLHTVSNLMSFPNAQIALSKTGWAHFHVTKDQSHHRRDDVLPPDLLVHLVTEAWPRVRLLEDEDELAPGLRTWSAGAHRRSSLCVEVETNRGTVAITDAVYVLENLERDHPIGVCISIDEALFVHRRLRASQATVVPLYDPLNFDRFSHGVVARAKTPDTVSSGRLAQ